MPHPLHLPAHLPPTDVERLGGPSPERLLAEVDRLLDTARGARAEAGGFGWLDAEGRLDPAPGRPLWVTTRMTHCFALGMLLGRDGDADLVDHGVAALRAGHADAEHGGWFSDPDDPGGAKGAYGHAFVVLAAASAAVAGRPGAADLLEDALRVQEQPFWDAGAVAVVEEWDAAFTTCDPYRGANANMHTVEAYLAAADATGERLWRDRAGQIAERVIDSAARRHDWRIPEHFDAEWVEQTDYNRDAPAHPFRPYGVTPGHGLEWSRLLLHLEAAMVADGDRPPTWLRPAAVALFHRAITDGRDGEDGGLVYTTDWDGTPVVRQRFHWVTCEGIATAALLHRLTGQEQFAEAYRQLWDYADEHFLDGRPGWQMEVDPDGSPSSVTWEGRPDVYHAVQTCLVPLLPLTPTFAAALAGR